MDQTQSFSISRAGSAHRPATDAGRPIRVLFLIAQFDTGGVQFQLYLRLKHLDQQKFVCHVAVLTGGDSCLIEKVRRLGVGVEFLHIDEDKSLRRRVARIRAAIARFDPNVVDALLAWDNTYGNLAATLENVPLIIAELQNEKQAIRQTYPRSFRAFESLALRFFCDRIVCCSEGARRSYMGTFRGFARKSMVIHDAIDSEPCRSADAAVTRRSLGIGPSVPVVGTIGRLMEQKDHDTFIRAASIVCKEHPGAIFLIGGYGHLRDRLEASIAGLGLRDNVHILGEISDVYSFYALVDVFVMTSRWEGFPVVLMEAMAAGKAVVSTNVGGIAEMIESGRNGFLCPVGNPTAIASAIDSLLSDPELRTVYGRRAREKVLGAFSIQHLTGCWTALYNPAAHHPQRRDRQRRRLAESCQPQNPAAESSTAIRLPDARQKILVLRMCPLDRFTAIIRDLIHRYPAAQLEILCQSDVAARLEHEHDGVAVRSYGQGRFSILRLGPRALWQIWRSGFDLVVLPYNNPSGHGYRQAEIFACFLASGLALAWEAWSDSPRLAAYRTRRWFVKHWFQGCLDAPRNAVASVFIVARAALAGAARARQRQYGQGGVL